MKLVFIAGEASGDAHGAALMRVLHARQPDVEFSGCGGPKMQALAGTDFLDWSGEAVVGIWDVLRKYPYFRRRFHQTVEEVRTLRPDAVIFVDYPGFNLRVAAALRPLLPETRLIYFISPQVWAWNRGRIPRMARDLDLMLCIFPFEKALYEKSGLRTEFVGHPLKEKLAKETSALPRESDLLGLFPGSREREVKKLFPVLLETAAILCAEIPGLRVEASAASESLRARMEEVLAARNPAFPCAITLRDSHGLMQRATAGIVASGTATMEAAFFGLPFILAYRVAAPTWWIGKRLVRVPFLGMPNLLAGREIVPEFLQGNANAPAMAQTLLPLLRDPGKRAEQQAELQQVIDGLGDGGCAERAADAILDLLHGA